MILKICDGIERFSEPKEKGIFSSIFLFVFPSFMKKIFSYVF
jgi:hypothetical protein